MSVLRMGGGAGSLEAGGEAPGSGSGKSTPSPMFLLLVFPQPCPDPRSPECVTRQKSRVCLRRVERAGIPQPCSCWAQGKGWLGSWQLGRENMVGSAVSAATAA